MATGAKTTGGTTMARGSTATGGIKGQHGDMRHGDSDRRQHGDEWHDDVAKRAMGDTTMRNGDSDGRHNNGKGSTATCGTTTATGVSTATARGSRATGGTTTATGDITRRHDEGDVQRTTTIRYFILVRLVED